MTGTPPLATPLNRFLARLVDGVIITVALLVVDIPLVLGYQNAQQEQINAIMAGGTPSPTAGLGHIFGIMVVSYGGYFLYDWLMHAFAGGQTVGKKVFKTRVVRLDGAPLPAGGAAGRAAVYALAPLVPCIGGLFALVNVLSLLWDKPYQQCYHDKAAKTVVVQAG